MNAESHASGIVQVALETPGDTILIDNWRMLHGRAPVQPEACERLIERVFLSDLFDDPVQA